MVINTILSPFASLGLLILGAQFFQVFISVDLAQKNVTEFAIGLIHASSYAGILISAIHSENLIKRIGHIRSFTAFTSIITVVILMQGLNHNLIFWAILRFISGISLAGLYVTIESWILSQSEPQERGKRLAEYMIVIYLAQAISPQILNFIDTTSMQPYIIAAILCALSGFPVSLTYKVTPHIEEIQNLKMSTVFNSDRYGFIGCLVAGLVLSSLYSFIPYYATKNNLPVSWATTTLIAGGFLLQWPLGKISDFVDRRKMLIIMCFICILPCVAITYLTNIILIYILLFIVGGITFVLYPICISMVCDKLDHSHIIRATGVLLFSYGIGSVLGPIASSSVMDIIGKSWGIFVYIIMVLLAYGIIGIYYMISTKKIIISEEQHVNFVAVPRQGSVANQLDPRINPEEDLEGTNNS